ncbi:MAG: hypothetical protein O9292_08780 [Rhodobacteraceae bacterium]|nr:hypothetical protein [Paracoccaceae bacterium]MCZ8152466.1 hypothetical protein [Paracoccaceae bacterium]MCZ8334894.1 hypothetical protein [Paracoccaceae bacterium]
MSVLEELAHLQDLISEWAEIGQVDLEDWNADLVMSVISCNPDFREKFLSLLEHRIGGPLQ